LDRDNFISNQEMQNLPKHLGFHSTTQTDIDNVFAYFDINKDGRVSISEMCSQFAEFTNNYSINDPSHWAFYIFENIRRLLLSKSISLSELFGISQFKIDTL